LRIRPKAGERRAGGSIMRAIRFVRPTEWDGPEGDGFISRLGGAGIYQSGGRAEDSGGGVLQGSRGGEDYGLRRAGLWDDWPSTLTGGAEGEAFALEGPTGSRWC